MPAATITAFTEQALAYFDAHAIDPAIAARLNVGEQGGSLTYVYADAEGGSYRRTYALSPGAAPRARQPAGKPLTLWRPAERDSARIVLVCEGESDALAALSALARSPREDLADIEVVAVPGTGFPVGRLAESLQRLGVVDAFLAFDADDAGRSYRRKAEEALRGVGIRPIAVELPDGRDLADTAAAADSPGDWIANLLADSEAAADADRDPGPAPGPEPAAVPAAPPRFIAKRLADALVAETPVATALSGQLYVFRRGAYRPDGEHDLRARIAAGLGDEWRRSRADETVAYLRASAPRLWAEPPRDKINCANGILDVETRRLERHDQEFLSPVQIAAEFDPSAKAPAIARFLGEVLAADVVPLIHEIAGYLVTPDQSLQTAVMLLGEGANGKSTALSLLIELLGTANVATIALHRLDEDRFSAAELEGKLANVFADLDARALQASSVFKAITGGDTITGERKYANPFSFKPYARLLYSANEPPPTPDSSDAFFRRWTIIPFERRFDAATADRRILDRLTTPTELAGLLNLGIETIDTVRRRGALRATAETTAAAQRFRLDSDSVSGFLADRCIDDPDGRVPRTGLFDAYRNWCVDNNRKPLGKQRFNRRVEAVRPSAYVTTYVGQRCWSGLRLGGES